MKLQTLKQRLSTPKNDRSQIKSGSWRSGKTTAERGYGGRWQRYRKQFLSQHPLCAYCLEQNRVTVATVVDHIVPHKGDQELFWDTDNHQSLCAPCHSSIKQKEELGSNKLSYQFMPDWLKPIPNLTIVFGCAGSGKSTWVQEQAKPNDIVLDLDVIISEISNKPLYKGNKQDYAKAVRKRNSMLMGMAAHNLSGYLILTGSTKAQRNWWVRKLSPKVVHIMQTPKDECIKRIMNDERRTMSVKQQQIKSIDKWEA